MTKKYLLKDVCNPKQWKTISQKNFTKDGYPVYGANGKIGFYSEYTHANKTILVTCRGATCGTLNISEPYSYINGNAMALDNLDENIADLKYLYYYVEYVGFNNVITGTAQPQITRTNIQKMPIYLPSLVEQKSIASILDKTMNVIDKRQQQIEALSVLKQSVFLDMFGSVKTNKHKLKMAKLGDFTSLVTSGSTPRGGRKSYLKEGIPLVRSQNVLWNRLCLEDVVFISEETHNNMKRSQLKNRDVLLNITGASIGRSVVYEGESYNANVNQHVCIIRLNKNINPYYLSYYFNNDEFQQNVVNKNIGATRQAFNYTQIKNFDILVPNITMQNDFEDKVKKVNEQISLISKSLEQINKLYDSILHKAFNGELFNEDIKV